MRKFIRIAVVSVIIIGIVPGIASAKTLYVVAEDLILNSTQTPADAFAVNVKVTTYNNQCVTLTFSSEAAVSGASPANIVFLPEIDRTPALPTDSGVAFWTAGELDYWDMAGFVWYRCGHNVGQHTVAIRYSPAVLDNTAYIGTRLLKIDLKAGKIIP